MLSFVERQLQALQQILMTNSYFRMKKKVRLDSSQMQSNLKRILTRDESKIKAGQQMQTLNFLFLKTRQLMDQKFQVRTNTEDQKFGRSDRNEENMGGDKMT